MKSEGIEKENIFTKEELDAFNVFSNSENIQSNSIETLPDSQVLEAVGKEVTNNIMNPTYEVPKEPIFVPQENNYEQIYNLQKENSELKKKLQDRKIAMALPAVIILIVFINIAWIIGVKFFIYPNFEENLKLNEEIKQEYESLKSKVNAIVGEEE